MADSEIQHLAWVRAAAESGVARRIRVANRLSLGDMARETGVHETTVWKWEVAKRRPRGEAALRYAAVLQQLDRARSGAE